MTVNERIRFLIEKMNYNFSSFSRKTGIKQSAISKTVNGINKPSFDFIEKILINFPLINAEWLILGKGSVFKPEIKEVAGMLVKTTLDDKRENSRGEIVALKTIIETQKLLIDSLREQIQLYKKLERDADK